MGIGFNPKMLGDRPSELFHRFVQGLGVKYDEVTMGFVPISGPVRSTVNGNVLLVGDAAGFTMATNGGGIPTAMIGGRIAGKAVKQHLLYGTPLSDYERECRSVLYKPLKHATRTRRMGDIVFPHDRAVNWTMAVIGIAGLERAIRCKPVFYIT